MPQYARLGGFGFRQDRTRPWQWHPRAGRRWIDLSGHQHRKAALVPDPPRNMAGFLAGTKEEIGTRWPHNGRTGILGNHEPPIWARRFAAGNGEIGGNEKWRPVNVKRLIDRN
jgi:hypothetical protein